MTREQWLRYYNDLGEEISRGEWGVLYEHGFVCSFCGGRDEHFHGCQHPYVLTGEYKTVSVVKDL